MLAVLECHGFRLSLGKRLGFGHRQCLGFRLLSTCNSESLRFRRLSLFLFDGHRLNSVPIAFAHAISRVKVPEIGALDSLFSQRHPLHSRASATLSR